MSRFTVDESVDDLRPAKADLSWGHELTVVFAALTVSRWIETQTGCSIRKFVETARRYCTIEIQAGRPTITAADLTRSPTTSATSSTLSTTTTDSRTRMAQLGSLALVP